MKDITPFWVDEITYKVATILTERNPKLERFNLANKVQHYRIVIEDIFVKNYTNGGSNNSGTALSRSGETSHILLLL